MTDRTDDTPGERTTETPADRVRADRDRAVRAAIVNIMTGHGEREQIIRDLLDDLDDLSTTTVGPLSLTFPGGIGPGIPDEHLFVVDTRTGKPVRPHPTWHPGAAANAAALMFPGWPAEQIATAYGDWLAADEIEPADPPGKVTMVYAGKPPTCIIDDEPDAIAAFVAGGWRRADRAPTVAQRLMAAGGIVKGKPGPVLNLIPEQVVPLPRPSGLTPGGSCRVTPEPHDHDDRRAELLADDVERNPSRALPRTRGETIATAHRAHTLLTDRARGHLEAHHNAKDAAQALTRAIQPH